MKSKKHVKRVWRRRLLLYMSFQFVSFCFQRCFATFWTPKTKQGTPCFRGSAMHIRSAGGLILLMFWTMNIQWKCHEGNTTIDVTAAFLFPRFRPYFTILASHSSLFKPRWSAVHSLNKCNGRKNTGLHWQPMPECYSGCWFQMFFIFIPTWGNDPIWLIFFKWVETTN